MSNEFHRENIAREVAIATEHIMYELEDEAYERITKAYERIAKKYEGYYQGSEDTAEDFELIISHLSYLSGGMVEDAFRGLQENFFNVTHRKELLEREEEERESFKKYLNEETK